MQSPHVIINWGREIRRASSSLRKTKLLYLKRHEMLSNVCTFYCILITWKGNYLFQPTLHIWILAYYNPIFFIWTFFPQTNKKFKWMFLCPMIQNGVILNTKSYYFLEAIIMYAFAYVNIYIQLNNCLWKRPFWIIALCKYYISTTKKW